MVVRLAGRGPLLTAPGAHEGGVDRDDPVEVAFGVGLGERGGEDFLPGAVGRPLPQAVVGAFHEPKRSGRFIQGVRCGT